ncbi:MAG: ATP-dependent Clp protease ATP-binding subunit ClpA, partial [Oscillospiraceae bacterium]|nr:ATP-dependent Clp protease ATP-binding subunit ClpA [Oscillospiraceae bacterium]
MADLSNELNNIVNAAIEYADEHHYEYVTPELVLMFICDDLQFSTAFYCTGGDVNKLKADLRDFIRYNLEKGDDTEFSVGMQIVLDYAARSAENSASEEVCIRHLIHGMWRLDDLYAVYFMEKQGISEAELLSNMSQIEDCWKRLP